MHNACIRMAAFLEVHVSPVKLLGHVTTMKA